MKCDTCHQNFQTINKCYLCNHSACYECSKITEGFTIDIRCPNCSNIWDPLVDADFVNIFDIFPSCCPFLLKRKFYKNNI